MGHDFAAVFAALKPVLARCAGRLTVKTDSAAHYAVDTQRPSPFAQHKGHPLCFGSVQIGKAYVSLHLVPVYMCPTLNEAISPALKKRMQGKACFNFKSVPDAEVLGALEQLVEACLEQWSGKGWL